MNLIQKIFGKKKPTTIEGESTMQPLEISEVLSDEQEGKAWLFYYKHKEHIDKLVYSTEKAYEPSQPEDKNNPAIWKSEYWKWFLGL
jgi:hypothetical protein